MSLIHLPANVRYYLYNSPTDMRCSFNGLTNRIRSEMGRSPLSGDLFIFFNKKRDQIKILCWEIEGYVICHKRLEKGRYEFPQSAGDSNEVEVSPEQLQFILQGLVLSSIQRHKRYLHPA